MKQSLADKNTNNDNYTNKLLEVIVALLLRGQEDRNLSLKQQIEVLNGLGLRPTEIASILGRTSTHVNKELVGIRKNKGKPKHAKK